MRRMVRPQRDLFLVPARPDTLSGGAEHGRAQRRSTMAGSDGGLEVGGQRGDGVGGQRGAGVGGRLVAVGPGQPPIGASRPADDPEGTAVSELDVFAFPVQIGKIQPPLLPAETLARDRLLDWMAAKIHSRLVLIVADPGHGKTTLLADWSRRTRVRALWYRLDDTDRDWVVFVHHIVAAGREIDPAFAPSTASLLRELGAGMGDRASITRTLLAEIRAWVTGGTALLLDDFQVIDDVPEVREIVRELLLRGPDRLSLVISTRRMPTLPLARLRALGEVAELTTADLRFDRAEMERLFRETYRHPLESDLLDDLARTTEGWAATLRLVETAVRGRPRHEVREVIRGLSAREGDLHDYLAEEVVGRMPLELQAFLERCSLLQVATPQLAAVAAAVSEDDARRLLDAIEEAGLLSRRGRTGQAGRLLHPLVRSFLEGRLLDAVGPAGVAEIHTRIAIAAEPNSWWLAAHHYAAAGRRDEVARVLSSSLESILGSGGAQVAVELIDDPDAHKGRAWYGVLVARHLLAAGRLSEASHEAARAWQAVEQGNEPEAREWVLMTLIAASFASGDYAGGREWALKLASSAEGVAMAIAKAVVALSDSTRGGSLDTTAHLVQETARLATASGHRHFFGISMLNLGWVDRYRGLPSEVEANARSAEEALGEARDALELPTVHVLLAWSLAHQGRTSEAREELQRARDRSREATRFEMLVESADVIGSYFDPDEAAELLLAARTGHAANSPADEALFALTNAENELRCGRVSSARASLATAPQDLVAGHPAFNARRSLADIRLRLAEGAAVTAEEVEEAQAAAGRQGAGFIHDNFRLLRASLAEPDRLSRTVCHLGETNRSLLSINAELLVPRLYELELQARDIVQAEAELRPARWRSALRRELSSTTTAAVLSAAQLLEVVGDQSDIPRLRRLSRSMRGVGRRPDMGRQLARRLAPRVWVEDQGRVMVHVGPEEIAGTSIRRRALTLLCFLLSRPGLSASRDQVLDALWPDQDPEQSVNSLHQSVYFLRRVFEPEYAEDLSPGYLNQDAELLWLDAELVDSRTALCRRLMEACGRPPDPWRTAELVSEYKGAFALDFAYEDWASPYRETLHARFLQIMEEAIRADIETGYVDRAIDLSRRVLDLDPAVDEVEGTLVRLYRASGAHAAAAEQYGHYSESLSRDLGIDAPALEDM